MKTPALMVLGTASHVGKSTLAAGLCRILRQEGYRVAPFKAQNMSLNSAAAQGGEIGRAQAVQAAACGLPPSVDMNPILLKPTAANVCQWIVQGRVRGVRSSAEYGRYGAEELAAIRDSYARLAAVSDVMVLEGAGSPAEINLLDRDFANMWMAEEADARCLLVADIERGGAFAALYGTWVLAPHQHRIRAFVLNKFHGDPALLGTGPGQLRQLTGVPLVGVVPFHRLDLPEEDSLALSSSGAEGGTPSPDTLRIGVLRLPHISNFTDFEPLQREPGVDLRYVWDPRQLHACDVLILPGTKSTVDDLQSLRDNGLEPVLRQAAAAGKPLLGICGGYQMLGVSIADPVHIESGRDLTQALGLLPVTTVFEREKRVGAVRGTVIGTAVAVTGYFIQHGRVATRAAEALLDLGAGGLEGCCQGRIWGFSPHGLFDADAFRARVLAQWRSWTGKASPLDRPLPPSLHTRLDQWAAYLRRHLDLDALFRLTEMRRG